MAGRGIGISGSYASQLGVTDPAGNSVEFPPLVEFGADIAFVQALLACDIKRFADARWMAVLVADAIEDYPCFAA